MKEEKDAANFIFGMLWNKKLMYGKGKLSNPLVYIERFQLTFIFRLDKREILIKQECERE